MLHSPVTTRNQQATFVRGAFAAGLALSALALPLAPAHAYSFRVKMACATDYYTYCSRYGLESKELRQCINSNGTKLTTPCIKALVGDGEVSVSEATRRLAATGRKL